jgi:hypothetical protein
MYAPDAIVTIADRVTQPGSPCMLREREEVKSWLEDIYGRDMTHAVGHAVKDDQGAA